MSTTLKVNSLPLAEVIESIAQGLETKCKITCNESFLSIPDSFGEGQIRGVNFDNGLGIILYDFKLLEPLTIKFTVDDVHPIKYIYAVEGPVAHKFANEDEMHHIEQYNCAIVASEKHNGHVLQFKAKEHIHIISLEIDRQKFVAENACEVEHLHNNLQRLFHDVEASKAFYHDGFYGLNFKKLLHSLGQYEDKQLIRQFHLESTALSIFIKQIELYEDDIENSALDSDLRYNEIGRIEMLVDDIRNHLERNHSLESLSRASGLSPKKLQIGFRFLYDTTVMDYIIKLRLSEAAKLLLKSDEDINIIADKVGFDHNSHFSKSFKAKYGVSPNDFRKSNKGYRNH